MNKKKVDNRLTIDAGGICIIPGRAGDNTPVHHDFATQEAMFHEGNSMQDRGLVRVSHIDMGSHIRWHWVYDVPKAGE